MLKTFEQETGRAHEAHLCYRRRQRSKKHGLPTFHSERDADGPTCLALVRAGIHVLMVPVPQGNWCRHCMRAKKKDITHHEASPGGVSEFDYIFSGEERGPLTILAGYDGVTKAFFSNQVLGQRHESMVRRKSRQSDLEPSIIDVKHKASTNTHIPIEIGYEESPVCDTNSNGRMERGSKTIQGQIRTISKTSLNDRLTF